MGRQEQDPSRDLLHARARAAAGLHRRSLRRRSRRHARWHRAARRRSEQSEPAAAGRARDRSLRAGRLLRSGQRVSAERRARVRTKQGALRVPPLGPERIQKLPGCPARHGHRSSGQPRVPRSRGHDGGRVVRQARVSRHTRRHRLAHDDGERAGCCGMGRWRYRGGSRHARPALVHAHSAGARREADGTAAGGHDRDRPGPDGHRAVAQARCGRQVRRVLRAGARASDAGRPRDTRQHVPGVWSDDRRFPNRRDDDRLPAPERPRCRTHRSGRNVREGAGSVPGQELVRSGLHGNDRGRSRRDRAKPCWSKAPAGPRPVEWRQAGLRASVAWLRRRRRRSSTVRL